MILDLFHSIEISSGQCCGEIGQGYGIHLTRPLDNLECGMQKQ